MLLFIILVLLLSIPAIQTKLGKYATEKINEDKDTNINIGRVGLQFNGDIELKDIYIIDYKKDTLISIDELNTSVISFKSLMENKFTFGDVDIYGLMLNLKTYKGEENTNLDVFVSKLDNGEKSEDVFLLSSSDISIYDSKFLLTDENKEHQDMLRFEELNINATDFVILGPNVKARINKLSFYDNRGVRVVDMSTNYNYTLSQMNFDDLTIKTTESTLRGNLTFDYTREGIKHFADSVQVTAEFIESKVYLDELNVFYDEFGKDQLVDLDANLKGTLNNLHAQDLKLRSSGGTVVNGDIVFKNLFNPEDDNFVMDAEFNQLSSTYNDLRSMLPNVLGRSLPSSMANLGTFTINGNTVITSKTVDTQVQIESPLGFAIADLELDKIDTIDNALYKGNLIFDEFDLGAYLEDTTIGTISLNVDVDGRGFTVDNLNTFVEGTVYDVVYNNYYYSDIELSGNVQNKIFQGKLNTTDDHIDLDFNGLVDFSGDEYNYDFIANVRNADLNTLNFVERDSISNFKGLVEMKMKGTTIDNAYGNISFKNTHYKNQDDDYYFEDFNISSSFVEDKRFIKINSPDIIEGEMSGKFRLSDIGKLFENSLGSIFTNYKPHKIADNQNLDFNFKVYNQIAEVFYPELALAGNTVIRGHAESNAEKFEVTFRSPKISFKDHFADNIKLTMDIDNPLYNTLIELDSLHTSAYDLSEFNLINVTENDTLFIKTEFVGGKTNSDVFDLNFYYTINEENRSVVGFSKSDIEFNGNTWYINEDNDEYNKVEFEKNFKSVMIDNIKMRHEDEEIWLSGVVFDENNKNVNLDFTNVSLSKITPRIENLALEGSINGAVKIIQQQGAYLPESNIAIDNFKVNETDLGSFNASIVGNESLTNYNINVSLKDRVKESMLATGSIDVANNNSTIDVDINFNDFSLEPLAPFGDGNITNIRGDVGGNVKVSGNLKRPDIAGELNLDGAGLTIPYLNIDYQLADNTVAGLDGQSFYFNDAQLVDTEYNTQALLNGSVSHVNLSDWSLALNVFSNRLTVLNTQETEESLYYGTAFVSGDIDIVGPTDELVIRAEVTSEEGTVFKIPLNDTETFGDNAYIHFLTPEEKAAKARGEIYQEDTQIKGLEMDFDLTVNDNAEIEIVMDKESGSSIKGRGQGGILAQINTNGKFNMYGDFIVTEGVYNFIYRGLVQKEFRVLPGGTLVWEGEPLDAQINIEAVYSGIQANPSVLLDNPINRSIPVEVKIHLTEQLAQPVINFDLSFPNVESTINSELRYRLDSDEEVEFQALSLLTTGSFRSELTFGTQDALGLVSDRAAAILSDLFSSDNEAYQVQLDVDLAENNPNYETDSRVGFSLSTKISDRILVNGKLGVPIGGVSETVVAGDVEIEFLLNEDRTLRLNVFNRENSIRFFGEEVGYTQGVGISYNIEFDNFEELMERIFKGNNKKTDLELPEEKKETDLPGYMNIKSSDTTKVKNKIQD